MKIEMGESLILSWLRHVKQCQLVQLNWKPSASWELFNERDIQTLASEASKFFQEKHKIALFGAKGTQSHKQILRQGEIDVLGIVLNGSVIDNIFSVDIAFHEGGLHYGRTPAESAARVAKKLIRSTMIIMGYFNLLEGEVIFASPKINPRSLTPIVDIIADVNNIVQNSGYAFSYSLYANEEFHKSILRPVMDKSKDIADTSELFMRSLQMCNMFQSHKPTSQTTRTQDNVSSEGQDSNNIDVKIGQIVQKEFQELFEKHLISENTIQKLCTLEYSKATFGINFPVLKAVDPDKSSSQRISGEEGNKRYWKTPFYDGKYYITSQWYDRHRHKFLKWVNSLKSK